MSQPKIAMIGAGSVVFTLNLLGDILSFPELAESEIALMDIHPERLRIDEHKGARHLFARGFLAKEKCGRMGREKQRKEEKSTCTSMSKNGTT
jgi:alpha-galactosidase/6-phospho-beta-glucosidase family protein